MPTYEEQLKRIDEELAVVDAEVEKNQIVMLHYGPEAQAAKARWCEARTRQHELIFERDRVEARETPTQRKRRLAREAKRYADSYARSVAAGAFDGAGRRIVMALASRTD